MGDQEQSGHLKDDRLLGASPYSTGRLSPPPPLPGVFLVEPPAQQLTPVTSNFNSLSHNSFNQTNTGHFLANTRISPSNQPCYNSYTQQNQSSIQCSPLDSFGYPIESSDGFAAPEGNVYHTLQPVAHNEFDLPTTSEPKIYQQLQPVLQNDFDLNCTKNSYHRVNVMPTVGGFQQLKPICPTTRLPPPASHSPHFTDSKLYHHLRQPPNTIGYHPRGNASTNLGHLNMSNFDQLSHVQSNKYYQQNHSMNPNKLIDNAQVSTVFHRSERPQQFDYGQGLVEPGTALSYTSLNKQLPLQSEKVSSSPDNRFQAKPKIYLEHRNSSIRPEGQTVQRDIPSSVFGPQYRNISNSPSQQCQARGHHITKKLPLLINKSKPKPNRFPAPYQLNSSNKKSGYKKRSKILSSHEYTTSSDFQNDSYTTMQSLPSFSCSPSTLPASTIKSTKPLLSLPKAPVCYGDSGIISGSGYQGTSTDYNSSTMSPITATILESVSATIISNTPTTSQSKLHELLTSIKIQQIRDNAMKKIDSNKTVPISEATTCAQKSSPHYYNNSHFEMRNTDNIDNHTFDMEPLFPCALNEDKFNKQSENVKGEQVALNISGSEVYNETPEWCTTSSLGDESNFSVTSIENPENLEVQLQTVVSKKEDNNSKPNVTSYYSECEQETQNNELFSLKCASNCSPNNVPNNRQKYISGDNNSKITNQITEDLVKILNDKNKYISYNDRDNNVDAINNEKSPDEVLKSDEEIKQCTRNDMNLQPSLSPDLECVESSERKEAQDKETVSIKTQHDEHLNQSTDIEDLSNTSQIVNTLKDVQTNVNCSLQNLKDAKTLSDNVARKYKKNKYFTKQALKYDSYELPVEKKFKKLSQNVPKMNKSVKLKMFCKASLGNQILGKRHVNKIDYKLLNGGDDEDDLIVKKRKYKKRKTHNSYKIKTINSTGVIISTVSASEEREELINCTENIQITNSSQMGSEKRTKRKYTKRAKTTVPNANVEKTLCKEDFISDGNKKTGEKEIMVHNNVEKTDSQLWMVSLDQDVDPLEAGLISDGDDEVVFLGFDVPPDDDEVLLGFDISPSKGGSKSISYLLAQMEADIVTVECDPCPVPRPPAMPCPLCDRTFSSHLELVNHIQQHSCTLTCSKCQREFASQGQLEKHIKWNHEGGKRFACQICKKRFTTKRYAKRHLETIHSTKVSQLKTCVPVFYCGECEMNFPTEELLEKHDQAVHKKNLHQCDECLMYFEKLSNLKLHKLSHTQESRSYPCSKCDEKFVSKRLLLNHCHVKHNKKLYKCTTCNKDFTAPHSLKRHKLLHSQEKLFRCEVCQKSFSLLGTLKTHLLRHTGARRFQCRLCHKNFNRRDVLNAHQWTHTGEKKFECDICNERFRWRHAVLSHKLIYHSTEKPHVCEICGKRFSHPVSYKKHAEVHAEKVFYCEICFKSFSRPGSLKSHVLTHTDHKPFLCDVCNRGFRSKAHLRGHFLVHTKEKSWLCKFCNKTYKDCYQLRRHKRIVHSKGLFKKVSSNVVKHHDTKENIEIIPQEESQISGNYQELAEENQCNKSAILQSSENFILK